MKVNPAYSPMFGVHGGHRERFLPRFSALHPAPSILALLLLLLAVVGTALGQQPVITQPPQSRTNAVGTPAAFSITATGAEPLAYQWQKWNASFAGFPNILGANNSSLVFASVRNNDDGDFRVVVTNTSGAATSAVVHLYVLPNIVVQPTNFPVVSVGASVTTRVSALGSPPLAYQWRCFDVPLAGRTNNVLTLTNVPLSASGDYTVLISNPAGAITSSVARLTVLASPQIAPSTILQSKAVTVDTPTWFEVTSWGLEPFAYQWRLDGRELPGQTSQRLTFTAAQPEDEGDYTVVVTNLHGAVTSEPARLWVVPPASVFIKGNFTNAYGRLPYFYLLPTNYSAARPYPLWFSFHGAGYDETGIIAPLGGFPGVAQFPETKPFASYRQQERNPVILLWPTRRTGDGAWTDSYLHQASALLDHFISQFSVDTNRIFLTGGSEGVHAAWDVIAMRPGCFAGAGFAAGWQGSALVSAVKDVPAWAWCAADDNQYGTIGSTRAIVHSLRQAGANAIYTEYSSGGHFGGMFMGNTTPALVDWFLAQRRGVASTNEPLLSIASPTQGAIYTTATTNLALAGSVGALGQPVMSVLWTNLANRTTGDASGSNVWNVASIPLVANKTNLLIVTATTTSWALGYGGNTTFSDTLSVIQSPLRATLKLQGTNAILNWTGGGLPYRVQRAADLGAGDWTDLLPDATPPVTLPLPLPGEAGFYRIVGQ